MPPEAENKFKRENEDIKFNSQNSSKFIDTDPYSYISSLIIQFSKNITNGRGLSQAGVNSFSLFLLTGGLLYAHTLFPQTIIGILKLYLVPLLFFLYFIIDLLKNFPKINEGFMRIFKGSGFAYNAITNDSISLYELETCLEYKAFSPNKIIDIVNHLIKKNQFSPKSQSKLMYNKTLYEVKSINYIKDLLLEFEFTTKAVCIFLKKMEMRLDHKYLDKLIEKYCESPSVLFSVGKYHKHKINEPNPLYKLGYEFDYKRKPYEMVMNLITIIFVILLIVILLICIVQVLLFYYEPSGLSSRLEFAFFIAIALAILCVSSYSYLDNLNERHFKKFVNKYFLDKEDLDKNIIEDVINDLEGVYFKDR